VLLRVNPEDAESAYMAALEAESALANDERDVQMELDAANDSTLAAMIEAERDDDERRARIRSADLEQAAYYHE
jgi:hypothetical protein